MGSPLWMPPLGLLAAGLLQAVGMTLEEPLEPAREAQAVGAREVSLAVSRVEPALEVGLFEVRSDPARWLGVRVRFVLQFQRQLESWNPLLTRFGHTDWLGLAGWADERFTWDRRVFADPMERLFVRRGSALAELIGEIRPHERFVVTGVVREVLLGQPWIEVESLRPRPEIVGEGVILHVLRADEAARAGKWRLAVDQLERAMAAPLPEPARAELESQRRICLAQLPPEPPEPDDPGDSRDE